MRQIVLSDFTGEMMARRARERKRVYDAQVARYRQQADENDLRIRQDYEAALEAYKRRAAKWEEGGIGTKLALGLLRPVTILNILTLCLLAGVAAKFAAPHFLGGSGDLWGLTAAGCAILPFMAHAGLRRPRAPSLNRHEKRVAPLRVPVRQDASLDDERWKAGKAGEKLAATRLSVSLGNDWTLLSGYNGPGGEVDHILVGPMGVCAIEVKHINGSLNVVGDEWTLEKYDKYGNLVEANRPVTNKAGLSPSEQVNRAVKPLERFLARRSVVKRIRRAVVLTHERAEVNRMIEPTVDHSGRIGDLSVTDLFDLGESLSGPEVAAVVSLVERDHAYHADNRRNGKRGDGRRRPRRRR